MDLPGFVKEVRALSAAATGVAERLSLRSGEQAVNVHAYARAPYEAFLARHAAGRRRRPVVALAMNPGKNGAVQTGIPFTDVEMASRILPAFPELVERYRARLPPPGKEPSGRRLYRWGAARFGSEDAMLADLQVLITCPVAILGRGKNGALVNVPVEGLRGENDRVVTDMIQRHAPRLLRAARPRAVLILGNYAERVWDGMVERGTTPDVPVAKAMHPAAHVDDATWSASADSAYRSL
ncbi:MAG: uracil-DNA glycosylase family protein [Methanobacteriota archaeon]